MLSVSNRLAQQLLGTDFSTQFTSQKQSTGVLCEVLILTSRALVYPFKWMLDRLVFHGTRLVVDRDFCLVTNNSRAHLDDSAPEPFYM
jgi:hypothetical protein